MFTDEIFIEISFRGFDRAAKMDRRGNNPLYLNCRILVMAALGELDAFHAQLQERFA